MSPLDRLSWLQSIASSELPPRCGVLAIALTKYMNRDGKCWPSITTLMAATNLSKRNAQRSILELAEAGFINLERPPGKSIRYTATHATGGTGDTGDTGSTGGAEGCHSEREGVPSVAHTHATGGTGDTGDTGAADGAEGCHRWREGVPPVAQTHATGGVRTRVEQVKEQGERTGGRSLSDLDLIKKEGAVVTDTDRALWQKLIDEHSVEEVIQVIREVLANDQKPWHSIVKNAFDQRAEAETARERDLSPEKVIRTAKKIKCLKTSDKRHLANLESGEFCQDDLNQLAEAIAMNSLGAY